MVAIRKRVSLSRYMHYCSKFAPAFCYNSLTHTILGIEQMGRDYTLDNHYQNSWERANTCADSEIFVRGGASLTVFFVLFLSVDDDS